MSLVSHKSELPWDVPGVPVVKNPPSNAGDMGSIPGLGPKIPHATGQLSLRAATTEPMRPGACAPQLERENPRATTKRLRCNERSHMLQTKT